MPLKKYKKFLLSSELKPSTTKNYLWNVEQFYNWLGNKKLNEQNLKKYFDYLLKKYPQVNTINLRLVILNNYLKFLGKNFNYDLLSEQIEEPIILSSDKLQEFLDQAEKNKNIIGKRDKALLELLYSTGLKVGQIVKIKKEQIDEIKKQIIFDPKNYIDIKTTAWFYLEKYLSARKDDNPWLFINFDRSQKGSENNISVRSVERIIDKYAKKMQPILKINPQILRNTLAHNLKQEGAQKQDIKEALHFKTKTGANNYLKKI
ncbi:hypothetical protein C0580_01105 [Candidatus Parcubacteria bacterium]|nr:MAG: hypothetical protein C0580_01105 [Candidatus Parcubacteria bacterium]